ncbi:MAG: prolipoprotein diacylglyceryl transferase [Cyclobacteriaceae bacterium]|jgi:ethanolamine transporter EutH|nr:prolipoprotein diacylglyceryl transferase [Cyclobacteriaceae bacterium]
MSWINRLQNRWQLSSHKQVWIVLLVFACTGFTVYFLKPVLLTWLNIGEQRSLSVSVMYYIVILPLYLAILVLYGFIFGQSAFFLAFSKRFVARIISIFRKKNK